MHLSNLYARDLGVKVGNPILKPHFFPILDDRFITVHNSDKVPSKSYSYWPTVIKILKHELAPLGIKIFQVGTKDDKKIEGVTHFWDSLSFKQSSYLLSKTLCHTGIDSVPGHIASAFNRPTVTLIAHTYAETCKPLWNKDKSIILESHRNGKKPSFSLHEDPKTVDLIKPEEIAEATFRQLGIAKARTEKTLHIGKNFLYKTIDIIPTFGTQPVSGDANVRVRMDINFDENCLAQILQTNNLQHEIITNRPINEGLINALKPRISKIVYNSEDFDSGFLNFLRHSGMKFELNCTNKEKLSQQRHKFFHFDIVYENQLEKATELKNELSSLIHGEVKLESGKVYVIGGQTVITLGKSAEDLNFWLDFDYFRAYTEEQFTI